ncbi:MAG: hypothetical protein DRR42_25080 [Gammaproteobacteria bacterium]|nr:MAG: hypothetical protein DRR42_25080 [Gammaproteobacteria bacterium]
MDSVTSYAAAWPAVTAPANSFYGTGQTIYVRAVISDPFGSYDITSASVTIKNPGGTAVVTDVAMTVVDTTSAIKTYEYSYTIPDIGPAGTWTTTVTGLEGAENTVFDSGNGFFKVGMPGLLILKTVQSYSDPINGTVGPKSIPGSFMTYTILVTNTGFGAVDNNTTVITDQVPANTELFVGDINGAGSGPVLFTNGATTSGLSYTFTALNNSTDDLSFSDDGTDYTKSVSSNANQVDSTVTHFKVSLGGVFAGSDGSNDPSFSLKFRVRVK